MQNGKSLLSSILALWFLIFFAGCRKDQTAQGLTVVGVDTLADFSVTNTWECSVDGINFTGTFDTSFYNFGTSDTLVTCSGTSMDKRANISFQIKFSRRNYVPDSVAHVQSFLFDTCGSRVLWCNQYTPTINIKFIVDSANGKKLRAHFYGNIAETGVGFSTTHQVSGSFGVKYHTGTHEPKQFLLQHPQGTLGGHIDSAAFEGNALYMYGYNWANDSTFRLVVRTGASIRTGTYSSGKGDVALEVFRPSIYPIYVTDLEGNLAVTINTVNGNIIEGTFSGTSQGNGNPSPVPVSGWFRCKVKNYRTGVDSINRWGFVQERYFDRIHCFGGNVTSAQIKQSGLQYFLKVAGNSDNGATTFSIHLKSWTPFTTGTYQFGGHPSEVDSIAFYSPFITHNSTFSHSTYVSIDTLTNQRIVGKFWVSGNATRSGTFAANFY